MSTSNESSPILSSRADSALAHAGQAANAHAARNVFTDYLSWKADNTIRRQAADLARFVEFLS